MDDRDLSDLLGQDGGLVERRVAAADHAHGFSNEERGIAGGAVRDAAAGELGLAGDAQRSKGRSGGDDDRSRAEVCGLAVHDAPVAVDLQAGGGIQHELGARGFGLLLDQRAQVEARDALREAREILDLFDVEHLPAAGQVLNQDGSQPKAPAVHGRGQPRQPAADDRQVVLVRH